MSAAPSLGIEPAAIEPEAVAPNPIEPAAIEPAAIEPAAIEPAAIEPEAIEPAAIDPEAIDPAAIEPAAIEPAAAEPTSAVSDPSRAPGMEPKGTAAIPAGTDGSSALIVIVLTAVFETFTVMCWGSPRGDPSATACTSNWYVPTCWACGTVIVSSYVTSAGALMGPYGSGGLKLTQLAGSKVAPSGELTAVVVKLTASTCEAAWLIRLTIWVSSACAAPPVPWMTALPPVYAASADWQAATLKPPIECGSL